MVLYTAKNIRVFFSWISLGTSMETLLIEHVTGSSSLEVLSVVGISCIVILCVENASLEFFPFGGLSTTTSGTKDRYDSDFLLGGWPSFLDLM